MAYVLALFGKGVYFTDDFSMSRMYSPPDKHRNAYVFQCRVLTGQYHAGKHGLIEPRVRDKKSLTLYNSVVDTLKSPTIFVVFQDNQAYPEYLITYRF